MRQHKANAAASGWPGSQAIGPIAALTLALRVDASQFRSARHFAAWLGLMPRERSTGGKQRLGGISRAGNERLRQLLVVGAMAVIRYAKPGGKTLARISGCSNCSAASRASWRRWLWPTRWPAWCGP